MTEREAPPALSNATAASNYTFLTYPPASLTYRDIDDCGFGEFDLLPERDRIPDKIPMVLVIGQQKAGTSWLHNVMKRHPAVLRARDTTGNKWCALLTDACISGQRQP